MEIYKIDMVINYSNLKPKSTAFAKPFSCHAYYAIAVGKTNMSANFIAGKQRVIMAISALGMSVGIPNV